MPGPTQTPMMAHFEAAPKASVLEAAAQPINRRSTPEEQAGPLVFLNSDAASYINGVCFAVDGGFMGGVATGQIDSERADGRSAEACVNAFADTRAALDRCGRRVLMTEAAKLSPAVPKPAHVPDALVYDFDMFHDPAYVADPHKRVLDLVKNAPPVFWTPRNGGHWMLHQPRGQLQCVARYRELSRASSCRARS